MTDLDRDLRDAQEEAVEKMSQVVANSGGDPERPRTRRQLLTLAGTALAGGAALTILDASPAAAADDDPLLIGNFNVGSNVTNLEADLDLEGVFSARNLGDGPDLKADGTGRLAQAAVLTGNAQPASEITLDTSGSVVAHELVRSEDGIIWASTTNNSGSSTQWKRVNAVRVDNPNGNGTAFAPFRFYDSRTTTKRLSNTFTQLDVTGHANVPDDAVAIFGNLTATGSTYNGFFRLYPRGVTAPPTSSVNFTTGQTIANFFFVGLGTGGFQGDVTLFASGNTNQGQVHAIIDITAYVQ